MSQPYTANLLRAYRLTHGRLLQLLERLDDDQLQWRPTPQTPSLGFHFWHVARWADRLQANILSYALSKRVDEGAEVWQTDHFVERWGWTNKQLGYGDTGMGISDEQSAELLLPPKTEQLAYMRAAFAKVDDLMDALDDALLLVPERPRQASDGDSRINTVGDAIIVHTTHDSRHLGMIEALLGILTGKGTVTA
jgi:uncharacterized damage-inducible protein DinB